MRKSLVVSLLACLLPALASADEVNPEEEMGKLVAVQLRRFRMDHELGFGVGALPNDAFYKGLTFALSYTWHFADRWAWEVANVNYSQNFDTDLKVKLVEEFNATPSQFPEVLVAGYSGMLWKPVYGKLAIFNRTVIHTEMFLSFGGGVDYLNVGSQKLFAPLAFGGVGLRVFFKPTWSLRFDARDAVLLSPARGVFLKQVLQLGLTFAVNLGSGD